MAALPNLYPTIAAIAAFIGCFLMIYVIVLQKISDKKNLANLKEFVKPMEEKVGELLDTIEDAREEEKKTREKIKNSAGAIENRLTEISAALVAVNHGLESIEKPVQKMEELETEILENIFLLKEEGEINHQRTEALNNSHSDLMETIERNHSEISEASRRKYTAIVRSIRTVLKAIREAKKLEVDVSRGVDSILKNNKGAHESIGNMENSLEKTLHNFAGLKDEVDKIANVMTSEDPMNTMETIRELKTFSDRILEKFDEFQTETESGMATVVEASTKRNETVLNAIENLNAKHSGLVVALEEKITPESGDGRSADFGREIALYNNYRNKQKFMREKGDEEHERMIERANEKYITWKENLLTLASTYEDELTYEYFETLEKYDIRKDRQILTLPLAANDREADQRFLENILVEWNALPEDGYPGNLLGLTNANIRKPVDQDYRIDDSELPREARVIVKNALNTLLLLSKQLGKKFRADMIVLLEWALTRERNLFAPKKELDSNDIMNTLFSREFTGKEKNRRIKANLGLANGYIRENFQLASRAAELADSFEKKYFKFLQKNLFKIFNNLLMVKNAFENNLETRHREYAAALEPWAGVYRDLEKLFLRYFKEYLHIETITCEPGVAYDPDVHSPYMESEPDKRYKDDQIKSIINQGFQLRDKDQTILLKPVDVIVVRNR